MRPGSTLIVTFDGLRRDRVTPALMPNLSRFIAEGTDFANSRSIFPSETRVAISSLVTGCPPSAHGIVANEFMHPRVVTGRTFHTAKQEDLRSADEAGLLLDRQTLGERIAAAGGRMAVVSTATPGATWLMHSRAAKLGDLVFSAHGPAASVTAEAAQVIIDRLGPIPPAATPNTARIDYVTTALMELVYPELQPDLAIMWYSDPDSTAHKFGVASQETSDAQRGADAAFGRLFDWWRARPEAAPENILVMSDHGQITGRTELMLKDSLADLPGELVPGYVSSLYLPDRSPATLEAAVARLVREPWCGIVFTKGGDGINGAVPGTFDLKLVHNDHERSADIVFTLTAEAACETDPLGNCHFSRFIKEGGGIHGGLQAGELSTVLAAGGPAFGRGIRTETRCWLPDIAPTVLHVLGIPAEGMVGRVLVEGLAEPGQPPKLDHRAVTARAGGHAQGIEQWVRDGVAITDFGWSTNATP